MTRTPSLRRSPAPVDAGRVVRAVLTVAAAAALAAAVWDFVVLPLQDRFAGQFEDFAQYAKGIAAMTHGASPYSTFDGSSIVMQGFDYPPFAAVLMRPLGGLDAHWMAIAWLWLSLVALIAGAVIVALELLPGSWPRVQLGVIAALTFPPATYNLWHGQVNAIIFLLLALALREWMRGRHTRCAVIVGVAAGIKIVPVVLLLLLLRRDRVRALLAGIGTIAATVAVGLVVLGTAVTQQFITAVVPVLDRDNGWIYNESWNGATNRLLDHSVLTVQPTSVTAHALTLLLTAATLAVVIVATQWSTATTAERGAQLGIAVCAMLLAGSVDWYPVAVDLLIPLAAAAALASERGRAARPLWAIGALLVVALVVIGVVVFGRVDTSNVASVISGPFGWLFLQATSLPVVLTAALLGALAWTLRPQRSRVPPRVALSAVAE